MKHILKLIGALLLDQFIAIIAGCMMVVMVVTIFQNSLTGFIVAFLICFSFFAYISYNSAFKYGFHDSHRAIKDPLYHGYLYKGALAGALSAIPLLIFYIVYSITKAGILGIYYMIANMYWTWPMINIFPNHKTLAMLTVFIPMILVPWIGYIAGYKTFYFYDLVVKLYKKFTNNSSD